MHLTRPRLIDTYSFFTDLVLATPYATVGETRTKPNWFDPVLSADAYTGHIKENERIVQLQPPLHASDADSINSPNGVSLVK